MLLEGKALGFAVVGLAALIAAFAALPSVAQDVILAAAAITAARYVWGSVISPMLRWGREVHVATTSDLPERMERVEARLDRGQDRFAAIEAAIDGWASVERAAVTGAIEASRRPRSARATDPGERTGWRE